MITFSITDENGVYDPCDSCLAVDNYSKKDVWCAEHCSYAKSLIKNELEIISNRTVDLMIKAGKDSKKSGD